MDFAEAGVPVGFVHADELGLGKALQELAAVAFLEDARVEDGDDAFVVAGADEAPDALAELDERFGEVELGEGVAAAFLDVFGFGFGDGMGGDVEGEAGDDDLLEGGARYVHAGPKAVGAEKHAVAGFEEGGGHVRAAHALTLGEEGASRVDEFGLQGGGDFAQVAVAGEEYEAAS